MDNKEAIIGRIKKLQAHAESAKKMGSIAEAEAFAKKATEMLIEHNINQMQLDMHKDDAEFKNWGFAESISYHDNQSGSRWRMELVGVITRHNLCNFTYNSYLKTFKVYGRMENVDTVVWLYHFLSIGLLRIAQEHHVALPPEMKKLYNRYAYLKDFLLGAVRGIDMQLTKQKREMEAANNNLHALIVYNDKALNQFLKQEQPNIKVGRKAKAVTVGFGYEKGLEVGKNFNVVKAPLNESDAPKTKLLK